jgi:hypothetical protein
MERKELILKQEKVLDFLINHAEEKGFPPTLREIRARFGLTGPKAPQKTLNILERKGYLKKGSRSFQRYRDSGWFSPHSYLGRTAHFNELKPLREENATLRETVGLSKLVNRAKGILMEHEKLSEQEAFGKIQKISIDRNKKMKEIAEALIFVYPAPRKALFFPGLAPRSGTGRTGNVGLHQNFYLKESLVFQHGVRGL